MPLTVVASYYTTLLWTIEAHIVNPANEHYAVQNVTVVHKQERQACMMF